MKKAFADLHMRLNLKDRSATLRMITKAANLGYRLIATPLTPQTSTEEITTLREASKELGVDFVTRVDLRPRTPNDLTHQLRRLRRKFEVICVSCENKPVARQAAKDRRVDLLNFPLLRFG
jgi:RNase P/RNase MRP subunit p30